MAEGGRELRQEEGEGAEQAETEVEKGVVEIIHLAIGSEEPVRCPFGEFPSDGDGDGEGEEEKEAKEGIGGTEEMAFGEQGDGALGENGDRQAAEKMEGDVDGGPAGIGVENMGAEFMGEKDGEGERAIAAESGEQGESRLAQDWIHGRTLPSCVVLRHRQRGLRQGKRIKILRSIQRKSRK